MLWWEAAILGLVEGITEYLPISSTGHLIIVSALLSPDDSPETQKAVAAYTIIIQGGAILAVIGLYRVRVMQMIRGLLGRDEVGLRLAINILVAFLPAAVLGVLLNDAIEARLFFPGPVILALAVGGGALLFLTPWQRRHFKDSDDADEAHRYVDLEDLRWQQALIIGLLQCVAMWPGTSRSMMTIIGGMFMGLRPRQAAEFSFLLGLPTLGGACVYKAARDVLGDGPPMTEVLGLWSCLIGFVVAMISAAIAVKWLVSYLSKHGVALFGWYRLGLCVVLSGLVWGGVLTIEPREHQVPGQTPEEIPEGNHVPFAAIRSE